MIVMRFGGASVQDAQTIDRVAAIVRERLHERSVKMSALANKLSPDNNRAPEARKSLAHPEASNAKPEGWVGYKMRSSPVGAAPKEPVSRLTASLFPSPKLRATRRQVSGHEFTRAVKPLKKKGFSPCTNLSAPPRLRGGFAAKTFLRASVPPWRVFP